MRRRALLGAALLLAWVPADPRPAELLVDRADPGLVRRNGVLHRSGWPFTGVVIDRDAGQVARTPFVAGREHGWAFGFYADGRRRYEKFFQHGRKEGTHRGFWENGAPQFVYHYQRDVFEGEQVSYFRNGQPAELRHYRAGHEDGLQRAFSGDGQLVSNYTFRNGRRYGIVGRFDCVSVHEK